MSAAETSKDAFSDIRKDLGKKQFVMLLYMSNAGPMTNKEISQRFGLPINEVTPRVHELRHFGIVHHVADKKDPDTGKMAMVWEVFEPEEAKKNFKSYLEKKASAPRAATLTPQTDLFK